MDYLITFLEGFISFISPCMLPMLPLYISYFAGGNDNKTKTFFRALCFVLGFTAVFCSLGVFAGTIGALLSKYKIVLNIVCGLIIILFGLSYLEILKLPFLKGMKNAKKADTPLSAFIFGVIYSVSLTPCVGAFLGSALMMASTSGTVFKGLTLLLAYSFGLGIPFLVSALILENLNNAFKAIKKHYKVINTVCGIFLIVLGILVATGVQNKILLLLSR